MHFDVKSVIDSFPILLYEKVGHNGDQIEWTIYWHTKPGKLRRSTLTWIFCQTIVGSKFFIIMEASGRPKHTRIYSKPPIFSFKQQWKNFYNQIVHEVHIKIPASLIIQKLAFDNKEGMLLLVRKLVWTEVRNFQSHLHTKSECNFLSYMQNHLVPISPLDLTTIVLFQVRKATDWAFMRRKQRCRTVFMESGIRRSAALSRSSLLKILCLISIQDDAEGIWKIMANNRSFLFSLLSMGQVIYLKKYFSNYFHITHSFKNLHQIET